MKEKDYIYLLLAFILGYFANSIIKQMCGLNVEGLPDDPSEVVGGVSTPSYTDYLECNAKALNIYMNAMGNAGSSPQDQRQAIQERNYDYVSCIDSYIKSMNPGSGTTTDA